MTFTPQPCVSLCLQPPGLPQVADLPASAVVRATRPPEISPSRQACARGSAFSPSPASQHRVIAAPHLQPDSRPPTPGPCSLDKSE